MPRLFGSSLKCPRYLVHHPPSTHKIVRLVDALAIVLVKQPLYILQEEEKGEEREEDGRVRRGRREEAEGGGGMKEGEEG